MSETEKPPADAIDPTCLHCIVGPVILDFLKANPDASRETLLYGLCTNIAEVIGGTVDKSHWISTVNYVKQAIIADLFGYDRSVTLVVMSDPKNPS